MLSPHERTALFDALRPPPGFVLEQAIGTSFTLDLEALLTAPIAFALFASRETDPTDDGLEPVGLLEAIRRNAGRITMFCQAGQIAVPSRHRTVFAWLEDAVREVSAPRRHRIFHPKVWLARYRAASGHERVLRLLCGTRNLTFDTSWDTLLRLESEPYVSTPGAPAIPQLPVADLFRRLPELAVRPVSPHRRAVIDDLADDLASVLLAVPEPFDEVQLHVLGLDRETPHLFPTDAVRALAVSPFLSEPWLRRFTTAHESVVLVSREESLDRMPPDLLARVQRVAVLNTAADVAPERAPTSETNAATLAPVPTDTGDPARLFGGLHAKLYVFDTAGGAVLFTGSANATEAAFDGNVEVLAELRAPAGQGVERLLADTRETDFNDLLLYYTPLDHALEVSEAERLELDLDELRRRIAALAFVATVRPSGDHFELTLTSDEPLPSLDVGEVDVSVRPVTLADRQASRALAPGNVGWASFTVTLEGVSAFFAVTATARRGPATASTTFLITADLSGAPADRESRLLAAMLRDPGRLLRYLVLLLADADPLPGDGAGENAARWVSRWGGAGWDDIALLELLVRAADRFPDRLVHIQHLLRDLGDQSDRILPAGFAELWEPIWQFHQDRDHEQEAAW